MSTTLTPTPRSDVMRWRFDAVPWLWRFLVYMLFLLVVLCALTGLAGIWVKANMARQYPAPGRRVDVGGYQLHLHCIGERTPTVILEAGLNDFSVQWALVQPDVSHFARVCTYDRAGLGWSERSPHPRGREVMAQELHTLLTNAGIQGPFVAVGHSFGGMVVRTFAQRYPNEVMGIVLVDAAHEAQLARIPALQNGAAALRQQFGLLAKLSALGLIALSPEQIPNRGLPDEALAHYRAVLATTGYFDAASAETTAFFNELEAAPDATPVLLGDLPLIVLSRGQAEPIAGQSAAEQRAG